MVDRSLLRFELPDQTLRHGGDSSAKLKGESILDSDVSLRQTLVFETYLIVLHSNNVVSLYNKEQKTLYNILTFKDLDSEMRISGFQNKKEDVIFVMYSDFHLISIIFKARS